VLIGVGISSGESSVRRLLGRVLDPVAGRTATLDLDDLHQAVEYGSNQEWANTLDDSLRTRQQAAMVVASFLVAGFRAVVIVGPFFQEAEIKGPLIIWVRLFSRADGGGKIIHVVEEGSLAVPDLDASI